MKLNDIEFLYHGTTISPLASILRDGVIEKGVHWGRVGEPDGVRLTRSYKIAKTFAERDEEGEFVGGGILMFDKAALLQAHKITPYVDVDAGGTNPYYAPGK